MLSIYCIFEYIKNFGLKYYTPVTDNLIYIYIYIYIYISYMSIRNTLLLLLKI
jgi:hypothetical protein